MNLYIDIETIPTQRKDVCDYIEESMRDELSAALNAVKAPANYKDADKITAYCDERRAQLQSEFLDTLKQGIEKTGLDGSFGQVYCIGWAMDDDAPDSVHGMDEPTVLQQFAQKLGKFNVFDSVVIGHNVAAFDLRFLFQRYVVNGIRPPLVIARAIEAKPWEKEKVYDTMIQWGGTGNRTSLDKLCRALSIPSPKGELDGSKVWQWVQDGKGDEVADYCRRDVEATRAVHRRMRFVRDEVLEDVPG